MATAAGYAVLPISPSLLGITAELRKELVVPTQRAAKQAGDSIKAGMASGVDQAAKNVEKANYRILKSAQEMEVAESKLTEQKYKTEAASQAVETAARKRADAESKGIDAIEKAEQDLLKKRAAAEREIRNLAKAEEGVEKAMSESARAAESLTDRQEALDKANQDAEGSSKGFIASLQDMQGEMDDTATKSSTLGDKITSGFSKIGAGALLGVGAKIGTTVMGGIGTAFEKGFGRLQSIEQAETMLSGLGNSASEVQSIMDSAMESVSGTAFGFGEAAQMAATFAGAGIKESGELTNVLTLVGDTAAIAGADFNEMGSIWTKVATSQRLSTEEMNQLMDRGLGVLPELQKHYGVTADEARKMVTDGKVSFEDFSEVMENMVGGSAQAMGETFAGSAANMQAALGRVGASLMEPVYAAAPAVFEAIGGAVDKLGEHLGPLIESFSERLVPVMEDFAERLGPWLEETIDRLANGLKDLVGWIQDNEEWLKSLAVAVGTAVGAWKLWELGMKAHNTAVLIGDKGWKAYIASTKIATVVTKLFNKATKANVIGLIVTALAALVAGLVYFFTKTETGQKVWKKFTDALVAGWDWVTDKVGGGIDWITEKFEAFTGWISTAWEGITSLFSGDYTGAMSEAFGIEEDNPAIKFFFTIRDTIEGVKTLISDVGDYITGVWDILFKGDYTGLPFGLDEDSGLVNFFFNIREAAIKAGEIIGNVWDWIVTAGKVAVAIIGTLVLTPLIITWNALSAAWEEAYEHIIKPVLDDFAAAATWLWETVLSPTFTWISEKWAWLSETFQAIWETIRTAVFDAFNWYIDRVKANWEIVTGAIVGAWTWVSENFALVWDLIKTLVFAAWNAYVDQLKANWDTVTGAIVGAWTWVKDTFVAIWESIKTLVFDAWNNNTLGVKSTFEGVTTALSNSWTWVKDQFSAVWNWIRDNVFAAFTSTIETLKGTFDTAVDAMGRAFNKLKALTAEPVNFIIRTVYTNGIREAWGAVAGLVDLPDLPEVKEIGGFAQGTARVPGARTRHDNMHMVSTDGSWGISLRGDEGVIVPEVVDALGESTIDRWNAIGLREGASGVARSIEHMGGFADGTARIRRQTPFFGGAVSPVQRSQETFVERFFPNIFTLTSATRYTDTGLHSQGLATDWQDNGAQQPTPRSKALARAIATNFPNTAELIHWPLDGWQNISNGQPYDFGPGTNAGHGNHVHWGTRGPVQFNGDDIVLSDIPGGGVWESITSMVKKLWDGVVDKIPGYSGDTGGSFGELPGAFLKKAATSAWDFIKEKADAVMNFVGGGSGDAEKWRPLASQALKRMGYGDEYLDAMVQQIQIESTGDPNAINLWDSNYLKGTPSKGLLQVIEPTYRDVRNKYPAAFEGLPDDMTHPLTNLTAGVGAVKRDWGGPGGRWPTRDGYDQGGWLNPGTTVVQNDTGKPEPVFNPAQWDSINRMINLMPFMGESMQVVAKEMGMAFAGSDAGYKELAKVLGNAEWAKAIVNGAATLGVISRDTDFIAANAELQETSQKAGRGFLETQATSILDVVGLGGLVSMGSSLWDQHGDLAMSNARSLYGATQNTNSTATVSAFGRSVTLHFNAESLDDVVRIGDLQKQANRIDGLEVKINEKKKPLAATVTRGGAM